MTTANASYLHERALLGGDGRDGNLALARLFMTIRGEIAQPRCETGARSPEDPKRTRAVR